ncbi:nitrate reductase cytochrome c-type subunit [Candidatus Accumulibacter sp. ACC007]|uniref:nitrate reductase cytochrome c-type subunit n=1 Tax=Candidatus Accumulibacter sp. ACC007 TaxID=2823333 RepID=UPI0025BB233C|nr:nitrate reductase cytochrome c-type subunit [Candidatus Accumulibacter sp. ACC007]
MKHSLKLTIAVVASCLTSLVFAADATTSMRGIDVAAPSPAPEIKDYAGKRPGTEEPVARTFSTQPPVIPHAVQNFDEINLEGNQCMDCHSAATYQKKKAPKMGDSHFIDRDGKKHAEATGGRYSCVQCHVPQVDAPPLVDNTFKGDAVKKPVKKN